MANTQTTTQQVQIDPFAHDMQKNLWGAGQNMTAPFLQTPGFGVAGLNPDQEQAFSVARVGAQNAFSTRPDQLSFGAFAPHMVGGSDITGQMNPFLQGVIDPTVQNMRKDYETSRAELGARAAASGGFGGSREAVQGSNLDRNFADRTSQTVAQLMAQGYDKAQSAAFQNASNGLQGNQQMLSAFGLNNTAQNDAQARSMQWLQQLISQGDYQRKAQQQAIDLPFTMLDRLRALTPQQLESTTTKTEPDNSPSGGMQALGAGLTLAGLGTGGGTTLGGTLLGKLFK